MILFTGVGKSGFIAQKISQTLVSTGTKAVFLNPTDALHGDIGIVGPADLLVALSKSGGSEELLRLMPYARVRLAALLCQALPSCVSLRAVAARRHAAFLMCWVPYTTCGGCCYGEGCVEPVCGVVVCMQC